MNQNIEDIIKLLVKDHYLSPLNGEWFKKYPDNLRVMQVPVDVLRENLNISLDVGKLTPRNIRDFKSLLEQIQNVKDEYIISIELTQPNRPNRSIYIDKSLSRTFDEL